MLRPWGHLKPVALAAIKRGKKEHAHSEGKKESVEHRVSPGFESKIAIGASNIDLDLVWAE